MSNQIELKTPDLGEFENVPIIEIFVQVGDVIATDEPLLAIESDKATMEIPASNGGVVKVVNIAVGDRICSGQVLFIIEADPQIQQKTLPAQPPPEQAAEFPNSSTPADAGDAPASPASSRAAVGHNADKHTELLVLGAGPGGYTAAFRAADLGLQVTLVEKHQRLGGVCLNVGCIPSKALLHVARVIAESEQAEHVGLTFAAPKIDIKQTLSWKNALVNQLTQGLSGLAKKRKVTVIQGVGQLQTANMIEVSSSTGSETISFDKMIIAVGSESVEIADFPHHDARVMDSTAALALNNIPEKLLIVGGGIIGLEMATVYHALGSKISVVEMLDGLMQGTDVDLVRPLLKRIKAQYQNIWLKTRVTGMKALKSGIKVTFEGDKAPPHSTFDGVLVAVGRTPNGKRINAEAAGIIVSERGFIEVNNQQQTNIPHIFAIGDTVGQPMLAHKASHEGKVAAEVAAGLKSGFDAKVIPNVAYTDPEIAWVGITETEAKAQGLNYGKGVFPWVASGRSLSQGRNEGITKLLFNKGNDRIIGAGITGNNAGDLIAEAVLAIEMNADAADIGLSIHAHPTLAETLGFAAEAFEGTITDLYMPKKK